MLKKNKKLTQKRAQPRKRDTMCKDDAAFEAKGVPGELNELREELNMTLREREKEMSAEFKNHDQSAVDKMAKAGGDIVMSSEKFDKSKHEQPKKSPLLIIEESLQKNAQRHREKVFKILMGVLKSRIKNIHIDHFYPRFAYMECWQRDVIERIADEYKVSGQILPIITNINGEVLVGNTLFHAAESLGLEYIPAIRITAVMEESFALYWILLVLFAPKLGFEQWEFLSMQLKEFKGIGL